MMKISDSNFALVMKLVAKQNLLNESKLIDSIDVSAVEINSKIRKRFYRALFLSNTKKARTLVWCALKRSIVACFAVVTFLFSTAMCVSPIRMAFVEALVSWYEDYIGIYFVEDKEQVPSTIQQEMIPSYIPERWVMTKYFYTESCVAYDIYGVEGEYIFYQQLVKTDDEYWFNDENFISCEEISLNDETTAYLFLYDLNDCCLIWNKTYTYLLQGENVSPDILIKIAESIE